MQQFEVNMLAFMGVQPTTLMSGLVASAGRTDTTPPTAAVTSPAPGSSIANGASVTLTGTAADVGGMVAAVEVSVDGGETWHLATGTTSWSYTYVQHGIGAASALVRAVDDSANYAATPVTASYTVTGPQYTILGASTPAVADSGDPSGVELGLQFTAAQSGQIAGVRFYKAAKNTGTHIGHLWSAGGAELGSVTFSGETASGWQTALFSKPIAVTAGQRYVVSYSTTVGHYSAASQAWAYRGLDAGPLTVAGGFGGVAGVYSGVGNFPDQTYDDANYYVDAIFTAAGAAPFTAGNQWPVPGSGGAPADTTISAVLSQAAAPSSIAFSVADQNGTAVAGATAYNATTLTATFTPSAPLSGYVEYSVTLTATASNGGAALAAGGTWAFTTAKTDPTACPCTLYPPSAVPQELQDADVSAVTLGVRFTPSVDGTVTGVRFYKGPNNTGSHVGSLWTAGGDQLASGTFGTESASGWQMLAFASPVAVTAGTAYIAAYRTTVGAYSVDSGDFPLTAGPLSADSGMYTYGDGFPGSASSSSYLVDVVFQSDGASGGDPGTGTGDAGDGGDPGDGGDGGDPPSGGTTPSGSTLFGDAVPVQASVADDPSPVELGTAFTASQSGVVTGLRFYKGAANTGTHVGHLWSPSGALLASVTFADETASGWQSAAFATPVRITAGQTYVISYFAPHGAYAATERYFDQDVTNGALTAPASDNGLYLYTTAGGEPQYSYKATSYFVDVFFAADATSTPTPTGTPTPTATPTPTPTSTPTPTPTVTPTPTPSPTSTPTPTGTPTPPAGGSAETLFGTAQPANTNWQEGVPVQLAVRFTSSSAGTVTGIRYYRATGDTAADTVYLWSASGTKLATASVPAATGSGWQYAAFASPVAIAAGTEYRASYYSPSMRYAVDVNGLASSTANGKHLTALGGAYVYGTTAPVNAVAHNYWVDVQFVPAS
jgi:hypothetical protein